MSVIQPRSGDGFVTLADGSRRWGIFGAAGILLRHRDEAEPWYFLARRSMHCHQGGTWALPGGALNSDEDPLAGALREFNEEVGPVMPAFQLSDVHEDDHGGWSYWTVIVDVDQRFEPPALLSWETDDARWFPSGDLHGVELFPALRATLLRLGILN